MKYEVVIVDAFTRTRFRGNPAAVCLLKSFPDDRLLQAIAAEINLSETAFLVNTGSKCEYDLRWFTPTQEIDLCGHATLASAYVLKQKGLFDTCDTLTFKTLGGNLQARNVDDEGIQIDLPMIPGAHTPITDELRNCFGVEILQAEFNGTNYLVEVENMRALRDCQPNMQAIRTLDAQGIIVTTGTGCEPYDFASRYFAPKVGVREDPVTGSAHTFLAPYWAAFKEKNRFRAFQASERTGILDVCVEGDRVYLTGHCVTTLSGEMNLGEIGEDDVTNHVA